MKEIEVPEMDGKECFIARKERIDLSLEMRLWRCLSMLACFMMNANGQMMELRNKLSFRSSMLHNNSSFNPQNKIISILPHALKSFFILAPFLSLQYLQRICCKRYNILYVITSGQINPNE
jgi:hypothetical protein